MFTDVGQMFIGQAHFKCMRFMANKVFNLKHLEPNLPGIPEESCD